VSSEVSRGTGDVAAVAATIRGQLAPLVARLRGPAIAALAERLAAAGPGLAGLVIAAPRAVEGLREAHAKVQARQAAAEAEVDAATSAASRREALARVLRREVRDVRRRRGDLKALGRDLDLEALRERFAGEREAIEVQVELAVELVGRGLAGLVEDPTATGPLRRAGLAGFLAAQTRWVPRFTLRMAAISGLQRLCEAFGAADPDGAIAGAMRARAADPEEHAWVRAAAIEVWTCVAPSEAPRIFAAALDGASLGEGAGTESLADEADLTDGLAIEGGPEGPRGFLLRRLVVEALARRTRAAWAVDLLAGAVGSVDPSEHVRIGLTRAAGVVARREPMRGAAMLAALADPQRERCPQVRAWAVLVAAEVGEDATLARALVEETATTPLLVACEAAAEHASRLARGMSEERARRGEERDASAGRGGRGEASAGRGEGDEGASAGRGGAGAVVAALVELAAHAERPAAVHEAAAAALEAIDRASDPLRGRWTELLRAALRRARPGGKVTVALRGEGEAPDEAMLGRILAELTRDDWGVDADVLGDRLVLRRGDRWRTRLWRVLHELRRPAPGKRAAHPHGRGRVVRGTLRAPSGRLHEVTATGVPGERVHVEREGGWGRHLPRVDDLLGMPLIGGRPVRVVSSLGVCTLTWRVGVIGRAAMRLRLALRYGWLAELRVQSLAAEETAARGRYVAALRGGFGIEARFAGHPRPGGSDRLPGELAALFPEAEELRPPPAQGERAAAAVVAATPAFVEWLSAHGHYFLSVSANSQQALAYFLLALVAVVLAGAFVRRRQVERARTAIPLVIGGWGTRGKSGTERLKLGLLHGLGYRVFAKTTGCEAMFLHAAPQGPPLEIFTFRPYGKATIWEQRTLLRLAAELRSEVFLWECMALTPAYVEILQRHWMRDDVATITNAYPDHEDIQGPAGMDVAEVIARFVPDRSRVVTSEINFLPVMQAAADRNRSTLVAVGERAGDLLAPDLLALLPYDEHPRNVALVARLAEDLGIDPTLAIVTMADHVVPDLGVLKRFGPARVRGRVVEFLNGCSANERTGFLSNWRRTGCDRMDLASAPDRYVITAVNNREDRIARSQVFARVLVEDVAVDRHLLLGTNTRGLVGYVRAALAEFLNGQVIVAPEDMSGEAGAEAARWRLTKLLARLRVVPRRASALAEQLEIFARGTGGALAPGDVAAAELRCAPWLTADADSSVSLAEVQAALQAELGGWARAAAEAAKENVAEVDPPEVDVPAAAQAVADHWIRQVARTAIAARLHARLAVCLTTGPAAIEGFNKGLRAAYEELFLELIDVIEDPLTTGDQVVVRCALAAPPGVRVTVMGTQNIKGTGLDFVYRWIAVAAAQRDLQALASRDAGQRAAAWSRLASPDDPGLIDSGLVAARLAAMTPRSGETAAHGRALAQAQARHAARRAALGGRARTGRATGVVQWLEGWVDFVDAVVRHRRARQVMRDLADRRISHARAALVMRELDARAKGGWLARRWLRG
jgi:poly-gamma-glutamate synthase PgsB/CapB